MPDRRMACSVLLAGARGFIGSHVRHALLQAGHRVTDAPRVASASAWRMALAGADVAVNTVGIFRERGGRTFQAVHVLWPEPLFAACAAAGVKVVQLSALGADEHAATAFHLSKREADRRLLDSCTRAVVVQPSVVFGEGGASARLFASFASMPLVPLPGRGEQRLQPIHIEDLAQCIVALVERDQYLGQRVALVGPSAVSLCELLASLRTQLGFAPAHFLRVPRFFVRRLDADALSMLERGNVASSDATESLLGRAPRPISCFVPTSAARSLRRDALLGWTLPLLRLSVAIVWIASGLLSLLATEEGYRLLADAGIAGQAASWLLFGAASLDVALGVATLLPRRPGWLWMAQMALIVGYSIIVAWRLPEYWLHPFGPMLKNLPMLAAIGLLMATEAPPRTT